MKQKMFQPCHSRLLAGLYLQIPIIININTRTTSSSIWRGWLTGATRADPSARCQTRLSGSDGPRDGSSGARATGKIPNCQPG